MYNLENLINDLENNIKNNINFFIEIINSINLDNNIPIFYIKNINIFYNNKNFKIGDIAAIKKNDNNTTIIEPYDTKLLNFIIKVIIKNNFLKLNINKNKKFIIIKKSYFGIESKKNIFNFIKLEFNNTKIKIRNIKRKYNKKIENSIKINKISIDNKKKYFNKINNIFNKYEEYLNVFFDKNIKKYII